MTYTARTNAYVITCDTCQREYLIDEFSPRPFTAIPDTIDALTAIALGIARDGWLQITADTVQHFCPNQGCAPQHAAVMAAAHWERVAYKNGGLYERCEAERDDLRRQLDLIPTVTVETFLGDPEHVEPFPLADAEDADAVREFIAHRAELRAARARGTRLCGAAPGDRDLAWLTCTRDLDADGDHPGEHSWYRDRP